MNETVDPLLVEIRARIFSERLVLTHVLKRAGVSNSTWARWIKGGDFKRSTASRISAAIDAMVANRAAPPPTET